MRPGVWPFDVDRNAAALMAAADFFLEHDMPAWAAFVLSPPPPPALPWHLTVWDPLGMVTTHFVRRFRTAQTVTLCRAGGRRTGFARGAVTHTAVRGGRRRYGTYWRSRAWHFGRCWTYYTPGPAGGVRGRT